MFRLFMQPGSPESAPPKRPYFQNIVLRQGYSLLTVAIILAMIPPQAVLDQTPAHGKLSGMIRRLIHSAMHSSLQELLAPSLAELKASNARLEAGQARLEARLDATNVRIDITNVRIDDTQKRADAKFDRVAARLDEFGAQQADLIKQVAALERDHENTDDILRRIGRLEDRLIRA